MPDSKITALTSISTSTDPANDPLVIVDVSDTSMAATGTTKKVTLNQLLGASGTATLASATITGDLTVDTNILKVDTLNNRVGIGTASPSVPLHILNNTAATNTAVDVLLISQTSTGTPASGLGGGLLFRSQRPSGGLILNRGAIYGVSGADPDDDGDLAFYTLTNTGASGFTEKYRLDSNGVATWSNVGGVAGTAMTLNATGLGIGTASPATKLHIDTLSAGYGLTLAASSLTGRRFQFGINIDANLAIYDTSAAAVRMIIDGSGNCGIGVTPSAWGAGFKALEVGRAGSSLFSVGATSLQLTNNYYYNGTNYIYSANGAATRYHLVDGQHQFHTAASGTAGNAITFTQAMTLTAAGELLVGKTATNYLTVGCELKPNGAFQSTQSGSTNANTCWDTYSTGAGAYRFYVGMAGTVFATNTTISAISDARLKENVQDIDVGLGAILALKPRKFDWKDGKGKNIKGDRGFIAQEFETVFPNLIDEWKENAPEGEAPYKSVRQDLIPVLVKAIQELTARVQTLETR